MNFRYLLIGIACSFITASIGGSLTTLDQWYFSLEQPNWKPPDSFFPVIWSIIFVFIGTSFGISYGKAVHTEDKRKLIFCFLFNGLLNISWSFLYFYLRRPDFALLEVVFLWGSILLLMLITSKHSTFSSLLLFPYLVWVTIATKLNYYIVIANGPF